MTATIKTDTTLKELGVQAGDTLIVNDVQGSVAVVSLLREEVENGDKLSTRQFLEKWSNKFPIPKDDGKDSRLAHILEKHVN